VAELFVSRRADADLREIWRYIASDNTAAADGVLLRIDAKLQVRRGMRMLVDGNYLLLYEYDSRKDEVDLVAVDGRREVSGLF